MGGNLHASAVAKESASGHFAGRVHGDDGRALSFLRGACEQTRNKRAFAYSGRTSDADYVSRNRMCRQFIEQSERLGLAGRAAILNKVQRRGDGFALEAKK
jgi:hypothetical protein